MENAIPIQSKPLNIVEMNYDTLFDSMESARLYEILVSPKAQLQHTEESRPPSTEDSAHVTYTSLVDEENAL